MNQVCKEESSESKGYLNCPFCSSQCVEARQDNSRCPVCDAAFEIDDRVECVFDDTNEIRLPAALWNPTTMCNTQSNGNIQCCTVGPDLTARYDFFDYFIRSV
jgi:hypothetical protein